MGKNPKINLKVNQNNQSKIITFQIVKKSKFPISINESEFHQERKGKFSWHGTPDPRFRAKSCRLKSQLNLEPWILPLPPNKTKENSPSEGIVAILNGKIIERENVLNNSEGETSKRGERPLGINKIKMENNQILINPHDPKNKRNLINNPDEITRKISNQFLYRDSFYSENNPPKLGQETKNNSSPRTVPQDSPNLSNSTK